jgi:hypothetical protein
MRSADFHIPILNYMPNPDTRVCEMEIRFTRPQKVLMQLHVRMEVNEEMTLEDVCARYVVPQMAIALNALDVPFRDVKL